MCVRSRVSVWKVCAQMCVRAHGGGMYPHGRNTQPPLGKLELLRASVSGARLSRGAVSWQLVTVCSVPWRPKCLQRLFWEQVRGFLSLLEA